jgi:hypothetical protein
MQAIYFLWFALPAVMLVLGARDTVHDRDDECRRATPC